MFLAASFEDAGDGVLQDFLAQLAHLVEDGLQPAVVSNSLLVECCLLGRESPSNGLGLVLAGQTPSPRWMNQQRSLGDPSQFEQLIFETLVALLEAAHGGGR